LLLVTLAPFDFWFLKDKLARLELFFLGTHLPKLLCELFQILVFYNPRLQLFDCPRSVALLLLDNLIFSDLEQLQILGKLHHTIHLDQQRSVADSIH